MNIASILAPSRATGLGLVLSAGILASPAAAQGFDLVSAVPSDYYMVSGSRTNPERAFLDSHWGGVWDALVDSGIGDDLMDMVSEQADPGMVDMVMGTVDACGAMCRAVNWDALDGDVVYAQRMNPIDLVGAQVTMVGNPDHIWLFQVAEDNADATYAELVGFANGMLGMAGGMAGIPLELARHDEGEATSMVLDLKTLDPDAPDIVFSLVRHGSTIAVTLGSDVRGEVIALLSGAEGATSIASNPRFLAAFEQLPAPEDSFEYVDMVNLHAQIADMMGTLRQVVASEMGEAPEEGGMASEEQMIAGMINHGMDLVLEGLSLMDYSATVSHTEGYSVHSDSIAVLAVDAKDNRFYPLLGTSRPVLNFASRLPATTTGYSVSGGTDMNGMYDFMLGLVGDFGPMGQMALGQWEMIQEDSGFDLRRDVLSWIDGETISVDFELDGKPAWVTRMAVTDEAMASEKMGMVLSMIPGMIEMAAEEQPMIQMLGISVNPVRDERFEGFSEVNIAMAGQSMLCGVRDGAMIMASSGDAIQHCQSLAAEGARNITSNERLVATALLPGEGDGAVSAASYTDHSGTAAELADGLQGIAMMGGMVTMAIEEPEAKAMVTEALRMVGKLGPVIRAMDFFQSSSSLATFDGRAWHTRSVTHYAGPKKTAAEAPAPAGR